MASPVLHILAGPNGAGKTTLYEVQIRPLTDAPFVNADRLAFEALGRHALTRAEAELGQELANGRRDALMAAGESLVTESTLWLASPRVRRGAGILCRRPTSADAMSATSR